MRRWTLLDVQPVVDSAGELARRIGTLMSNNSVLSRMIVVRGSIILSLSLLPIDTTEWRIYHVTAHRRWVIGH